MSSEQLADSAQIDERTVTDFESDTRVPHPATLQAMARILALGGVDFYKDGTASLGSPGAFRVIPLNPRLTGGGPDIDRDEAEAAAARHSLHSGEPPAGPLAE